MKLEEYNKKIYPTFNSCKKIIKEEKIECNQEGCDGEFLYSDDIIRYSCPLCRQIKCDKCEHITYINC